MVPQFIKRKFSTERKTKEQKTHRKSSVLGVCNHGSFKLLVIGKNGVGKRQICKTYIGDECNDDDDVFDTGIFVTIDDEPRQYDLEIFVVEADGATKNLIEYKTQLESADGYMLVYSKYDKESFIKLIEIISDINHFKRGQAPIMVLGNKTKTLNPINEVDDVDVTSLRHAHFEVSNRQTAEIQKVFKGLVHECIDAIDSQHVLY